VVVTWSTSKAELKASRPRSLSCEQDVPTNAIELAPFGVTLALHLRWKTIGRRIMWADGEKKPYRSNLHATSP
jgi:hypothetical protein